ncbi:MAG: hypothetical protein IAE77_26575 [Prosthecobacter sp.]|jgi:hypothetical protein|nr:hypothetical protein [Prosthecobacter sp.]
MKTRTLILLLGLGGLLPLPACVSFDDDDDDTPTTTTTVTEETRPLYSSGVPATTMTETTETTTYRRY